MEREKRERSAGIAGVPPAKSLVLEERKKRGTKFHTA